MVNLTREDNINERRKASINKQLINEYHAETADAENEFFTVELQEEK